MTDHAIRLSELITKTDAEGQLVHDPIEVADLLALLFLRAGAANDIDAQPEQCRNILEAFAVRAGITRDCDVDSKVNAYFAEHPIDDVVGTSYAIIDEVRPAIGAGDEQRRRFALGDTRRHLNKDLMAVVEGAKRPPRRIVPLDAITEVQVVQPYTAISRTVHIHPTVAELIPTLLGSLKPLD